MSGCVQGHEPTEIVSIKLWLKLPVLAPSRSENMDHGRYPYSLMNTSGKCSTVVEELKNVQFTVSIMLKY